MSKKSQVFVSYRKPRDRSTPEIAMNLVTRLKEYGYETFIDLERLEGGLEWEQEIYSNIFRSDVLIVLLQKETADSEWVQREVDVARGAQVSILPLQVDDEVDIADSVKKLALGSIQHFPRFAGSDAQYKKLVKNIQTLTEKTRRRQKTRINQLEAQWRLERAETNKSYAAYTFHNHPCEIHLATGDITAMKGVDVIVNTENDYMQMAPIYERGTLSSALRREGALIRNGHLIEDTVQQELDQQIAKSPYFVSRPVSMTQIVPTHAGHAESRLAKQRGARYIFHAATVRVDLAAKSAPLVPIEDDDSIKDVVTNCLEMILEVDRLHGSILPEGYDDTTRDGSYQLIKSIVFPLLATGQGGRPVSEVIPPILEGVKNFLVDHPKLALQRIHLCAYSELDKKSVEDAMDSYFQRKQG
jgi:O-acetyl-ADP-ribose deacetylase (regulator of RNase III)